MGIYDQRGDLMIYDQGGDLMILRIMIPYPSLQECNQYPIKQKTFGIKIY